MASAFEVFPAAKTPLFHPPHAGGEKRPKSNAARRPRVNMQTLKNRYCMVCQTGIIRTGFSAADFRLNSVIRLANTSRVLAAPTSLLSQKSAGAELLAPQSKRFSDDFAPAERRASEENIACRRRCRTAPEAEGRPRIRSDDKKGRTKKRRATPVMSLVRGTVDHLCRRYLCLTTLRRFIARARRACAA